MSHVPAWKRIGLQLKDATPAVAAVESTRVDGQDHKRRQHQKDELEQKGENRRLDHPHRHPEGESDRKVVKKRKLTKSSASSKSKDVPRESEGEHKQVNRKAANLPVKSTAKKHKKGLASKRPSSPTQPNASVLDYLTTFYTDRERWKFNKNRQISILKHAFNMSFIPAEHTDALVAYVSGIKGLDARARIRIDAMFVLAIKNGNVDGNDQEHGQEEYDENQAESRGDANEDYSLDHAQNEFVKHTHSIVKEQVQFKRDHRYMRRFQKHFAKRKRAELILQKLREYDRVCGLENLRNSGETEENNVKAPSRRSRSMEGWKTGVPDDDDEPEGSTDDESVVESSEEDSEDEEHGEGEGEANSK